MTKRFSTPLCALCKPSTRPPSQVSQKLLLGLSLFILIACQSEPVTTHKSSSAAQQKRMLEAKSAILALDEARLEILLPQIDVNAPLADHSSLLAWAVETQNERMVNDLLNEGANANGVEGNRFSPIILACRYGNASIISALLNSGAKPLNAIEDGTSAFHLCASTATADILSDMISRGANVHIGNNRGQTPLMFAANAGKTDVMSYLIDHGADINQQTEEGFSALFFAVKSHNLNAIRTLISRGANLHTQTKDGTTVAQLAVYSKNYLFLTWLTSQMDVLMSPAFITATLNAYDRNGHQLLHAAVIANRTELVAALLARGANPAATSAPSRLKWRYEPNFKTEDYIPPQLTPIDIAVERKLDVISTLLTEALESRPHS